MVDIQTISIVVASAGVFLAAIYYIFQLRHQAKQRQTDMVMKLYGTFGSIEFQEVYQKIMDQEYEDYADYMKRYGTKPEFKAAGSTVDFFFEGVGVLVKRKLVSMDLVDDLLSTDILLTWEKRKSTIEGYRKKFSRPQAWEWFEYLFNEMKKREQGQ